MSIQSGTRGISVLDGLDAIDELITTLDVSEADASTALDAASRSEKVMSRFAAFQVRCLARFADHRPGMGREFHPTAADEVAMELSMSPGQATGAMYHACHLTRRFPQVLEALETGRINPKIAQILDRKTARLSDEQARQAIDLVLPSVDRLTPAQVSRRITRAVLKVDPKGAKERHENAVAERRVDYVPQDDAMVDVVARLTAEVGEAVRARVDYLARHAKAPDDNRTLDNVRADVVADLLLGRPVAGEGPKVEIRVTVPVTALTGVDLPAELDGYGPVHADLARKLAESPNALVRRIVTDPLDGTLLDYGRTTYRPPVGLADHVRARDEKCTFPGCPKKIGDLDHTIPYPKGPTSPGNLRLTCRRHHLTKQTEGWTVSQDGGRVEWTTPTGRTYTRDPAPLSEPEPDEHDPPPEPD